MFPQSPISTKRKQTTIAPDKKRSEFLWQFIGGDRLDLAAHKLDGYPYDYHRLLYSFRVKSRTKDVGIYRPDHRWSFSPTIRFKTGAGSSDG